MSLSVCIPTLNRYDLLQQEIDSLDHGIVRPDTIHIIDNGGGLDMPEGHHFRNGILIHVWKPGRNLGVSGSWNYFLRIAKDIRVIANDDLLFAPISLKVLVDSFDENCLVSPDSIAGGNAFSCFIFPEKLQREVGLFDESISPNWAYFEDGDMAYRMKLKGYGIKPAQNCSVQHGLSSTLKALTPAEMQGHHIRFEGAKTRYSTKWGGLPGDEVYSSPYNGLS